MLCDQANVNTKFFFVSIAGSYKISLCSQVVITESSVFLWLQDRFEKRISKWWHESKRLADDLINGNSKASATNRNKS